ncbi:hypothetical protein, partial [uncultured Campylobacter sp.]|uniref:hypothetical protein n=1 Tax=uncultured Campylobacter sp. TaxID=218934 RepID=UPI002627B7D8
AGLSGVVAAPPTAKSLRALFACRCGANHHARKDRILSFLRGGLNVALSGSLAINPAAVLRSRCDAAY